MNPLADMLKQYLSTTDVKPKLKGDVITVDGHTIEITATVGSENDLDDRYMLTISAEVKLDGRPVPAMRKEVVGSGKNRKAAITSASIDWVNNFARPFTEAVIFKGDPPLALPHCKIFGGSISLRSKNDDETDEKATESLENSLSAIAQSISDHKSAAKEWLGITLLLVFHPDDADYTFVCQKNGVDTHEYDKIIKRNVKPPACEYTCMLEQFILALPA